MSMVHKCSADGCQILTMGALCLEHERAAKRAAEAGLLDALAEVEEQHHQALYRAKEPFAA